MDVVLLELALLTAVEIRLLLQKDAEDKDCACKDWMLQTVDDFNLQQMSAYIEAKSKFFV